MHVDHWTVGVSRLYVAVALSSSEEEKENGFLEFMRQVRRREGERHQSRNKDEQDCRRSRPRRPRARPEALRTSSGSTVWRAPCEYRVADSPRF